MAPWFTIQARAGTAEIDIHDEVGSGGLSAADFSKQLRVAGRVGSINLHINSPGGSVADGIAIYNMLKAHPARVTVHIDGVAASVASVIAMAGDRIIMPDNCLMMLHGARSMSFGTADGHRDSARLIDKFDASMTSIYAARTGQSPTRIAEMMRAETWLTAAEALAARFCDEVTAATKIAAHHDLSKFEHPPSAIGALSAAYWARQKTAPVARKAEGSELPDLVTRTELPTPEEAFARWNRGGK